MTDRQVRSTLRIQSLTRKFPHLLWGNFFWRLLCRRFSHTPKPGPMALRYTLRRTLTERQHHQPELFPRTLGQSMEGSNPPTKSNSQLFPRPAENPLGGTNLSRRNINDPENQHPQNLKAICSPIGLKTNSGEQIQDNEI